jgi:hypothetical protein
LPTFTHNSPSFHLSGRLPDKESFRIILVPPDNVSFQQVDKLMSFLFFSPIYDIFPKNLGPCSIVRECWVEILVSTARPLDELAVSKRKFTSIPAAFISLILIIPVYLFFSFQTAISRLR